VVAEESRSSRGKKEPKEMGHKVKEMKQLWNSVTGTGGNARKRNPEFNNIKPE